MLQVLDPSGSPISLMATNATPKMQRGCSASFDDDIRKWKAEQMLMSNAWDLEKHGNLKQDLFNGRKTDGLPV